MNEVIQAARELELFCQSKIWNFCFIGGIAVLRWGETRVTLDADITLLTEWGHELPYIEAVVEKFTPRIDNAIDFASKHRVLLVRASNGVNLDVSLGALDFELRSVKRASAYEILPDAVITTCSAEDLIVHKAFANRERDWGDIAGVILKQGDTLNHEMILEELAPLAELKEEPGILDKLNKLLEESARS